MSSNNRKKTETYRFNGYPHLNAKSIRAFDIAKLESIIAEFAIKLSDPNDCDDKKWTQRWQTRFEKELKKKQEGLALKQLEQAKASRLRNRKD
jgi:hypothetical protein